MSIITLTSDWNKNDYYVAAVKGSILSNCPEALLVDITHNIPPFSIAQAAFILKNSYKHFPEGTIHIIAVNTEVSEDKPHIVVFADNHYFIGCDNGIFGLLFDENSVKIRAIRIKNSTFSNFGTLSVFSKVATDLVQGKKLEELGNNHDNLYRNIPLMPAVDESVINGSVVYIDSYKNAITNISEELFANIRKNRKFEILVQSNHYKINKINKTYAETSVGELLVLFNSAGMMEIAINNGNAADLLNLSIGSAVRIKYFD